MSEPENNSPGLILYQTEDGRTHLQVRLENQTVWLTQKLMAELFQQDVRTINEHIQNIFDEGELQPDSVIRNFRITAADGKSYETQHYNLEAIIAVGYRVKSHRGTQFRIWATQRLSEYVVKGFVLNEEELKRLGLIVSQYLDFAELQALDRRPMHMRDWIARLDAFLTAGGQKLLNHSGKISAEEAKLKAELEFDKFELTRRKLEDARADEQFARQIDDLAKQTKQLTPLKRKSKKK